MLNCNAMRTSIKSHMNWPKIQPTPGAKANHVFLVCFSDTVSLHDIELLSRSGCNL